MIKLDVLFTMSVLTDMKKKVSSVFEKYSGVNRSLEGNIGMLVSLRTHNRILKAQLSKGRA